ncbi:DUF6625 family protein [Aestuariivivens sp. NBU2969]|uniref:DUF6625 family protein n=1 Tax=Aestuariivivens sp. NBU2969 TaxID=2873267 RepID=UPI001CBD2894|nr:DUF6625 family protein [Aestuariivivens sp. NBU2969]
MKAHNIAFIVPYYGKWPVWFPAFLVSCKNNSSITWLFFSDCDITIDKPNNVIFYKSSLGDLKNLISITVGFEVSLLSAYKVCEFRPAFGDVFSKYIKDYDFWGFCDVDIIWGDIRKFITPKLLADYDILTALPQKIAGHFTIFKNTTKNNQLYAYKETYKKLFKDTVYRRFDEYGFTGVIAELDKNNKVNICWEPLVLDQGIKAVNHQEYLLDVWEYDNGKIYTLNKGSRVKEYMYLHFINWKKFLKTCEFEYADAPKRFYISYNKIHLKPHTWLSHGFNRIKNIFYGYTVRLWIYLNKRKIKSLLRRVKGKLS